MPDPELRTLTALRRLRRVETDEARRHLGEALAHETELAERDEAMRGELEAGRQVSGDFDRDAFSAWWARMGSMRGKLADAMRQAEIRTAATRTVLANRRVAETAAEDALAREMSAREVTVARRDQAVLEDVARALKRAAETNKTSKGPE
jgi:hypothetical protein